MNYQEAKEAFFAPRSGEAPAPGSSRWASPARELRDAIEAIAQVCFWAETTYNEYEAIGLEFFGGYIWGRACALGEPEGTVVAAAFGVFEPNLVAGLYDQARQTASLSAVRKAKEAGSTAALHHALGSADVGATLAVVRRAAEAADPTGRAFHAGLTAVPWPDDPMGQLWHACTMLREHRGDGHLAACVSVDITGLEANLLTEAVVGYEQFSYAGSRGWSPEAMESAVQSLTSRGLLHDGSLTAAGNALRDQIETATDRSVARAVAAAGPDLARAVRQLTEWSTAITEAGWFPPDPYKHAAG
jgi:hypothetical protein